MIYDELVQISYRTTNIALNLRKSIITATVITRSYSCSEVILILTDIIIYDIRISHITTTIASNLYKSTITARVITRSYCKGKEFKTISLLYQPDSNDL